MSGGPMLELCGVDAGYGELRALFDVSLRVDAGRVTALLGPNGAGKTTVARVATGLIRPTAGAVCFGGRDVTGTPSWRLTREGMVHANEGRAVFATLTVEENLRLALEHAPGVGGVDAAVQRAFESFPVLAGRKGQAAGTLSGGEQRMLALARVLAAPPRVLVADELSLGLAPLVVDAVYEALARVRAAGTSILLVEQHVPRALDLADEVVVLRKGRVVYRGPAGTDSTTDAVAALLPT